MTNTPSNRNAWIVVSVVIALLLALLVGYFLHTYEYVEDKPTYSLTPQATTNRFLASEKLLQAEHKKVTITKGEVAKSDLDNLWLQPIRQAKHNAVILYSVSKNQEARIPDMLRWVEHGGHLVTFSQEFLFFDDVNKDKNDQVVQDNLRRYQLSENVLLTHLGIQRTTAKNKPTPASDTLEPSAQETANSETISQENSNQTSKLKLFDKVVMRLPAPTASDPNNTVETVVAIDNSSHLDTTEFWQKYPKAQKWADYNWLNDSGQLVAPSQTAMTASEQQQLSQAVAEIEKKSDPSLKADEVMLDVKMGEGRLTVLNDRYVFTNPDSDILQNIAEINARPPDNTHSPVWQSLQTQTRSVINPSSIATLDNAYLLKYLMAEREQIWIVPDIDVPSLPVMLWRSAKWACVAFLLLLAVGLLALPKRFGRIRAYQTDSERNIFGYFDHIGQYLWQTDEAKAIFSQNRTRLIEQIIAKQPHFAKLDPEQLCQAIAEQLNIGKSAVKQALYNDWHTTDQFLQCTRQFAVIRQAFS